VGDIEKVLSNWLSAIFYAERAGDYTLPLAKLGAVNAGESNE
jgi:hypothetical protein